MAKIYNSDLTKELVDSGKLQLMVDKIPNELAEKVVPVMEVNPKLLRRINVIKQVVSTASVATTSVIYTVPTGKKLMITTASLGLVKDAACDVVSGTWAIVTTINGESVTIFRIPYITLTASNNTADISYPIPIELVAGTQIICSAFSYAAGNSSRFAGFTGYLVDNPNA